VQQQAEEERQKISAQGARTFDWHSATWTCGISVVVVLALQHIIGLPALSSLLLGLTFVLAPVELFGDGGAVGLCLGVYLMIACIQGLWAWGWGWWMIWMSIGLLLLVFGFGFNPLVITLRMAAAAQTHVIPPAPYAPGDFTLALFHQRMPLSKRGVG
ncbi:hypothetical protein CYMTET_32536, partial [Cymbomonas tetramitiformis]